MPEHILIIILLLLVAFFYASVGHGGASGYLAVFSLFGMAAADIKSSALILNVFVASVSFIQYYRSGHFKWKLFYPFIILSVPMAYLGTFIELDASLYKKILGICLLIAVIRVAGFLKPKKETEIKEVVLIPAILIGAVLGFVSGVIGIGGGIILSPLIILLHWGTLKQTSAVSALFIVVNSLAGIVGLWRQDTDFSPQLGIWVAVTVCGGALGAWWGSTKVHGKMLRNLLAGVLLFAALKLIFI